MFEEIGHHVEKIKRVRYGPLSLDVPPGEFRRLSAGEVEKLKAAAALSRGSTGGDSSTALRTGGGVSGKKRRTRVSDPHKTDPHKTGPLKTGPHKTGPHKTRRKPRPREQ